MCISVESDVRGDGNICSCDYYDSRGDIYGGESDGDDRGDNREAIGLNICCDGCFICGYVFLIFVVIMIRAMANML
jgi:hypothetical protein